MGLFVAEGPVEIIYLINKVLYAQSMYNDRHLAELYVARATCFSRLEKLPHPI